MNAGKYPHLCRCLLIPCHAGKYLHGTSGYLPIFNTLCIYIPQPQVFTLVWRRYLPHIQSWIPEFWGKYFGWFSRLKFRSFLKNDEKIENTMSLFFGLYNYSVQHCGWQWKEGMKNSLIKIFVFFALETRSPIRCTENLKIWNFEILKFWKFWFLKFRMFGQMYGKFENLKFWKFWFFIFSWYDQACGKFKILKILKFWKFWFFGFWGFVILPCHIIFI